MSIDRYIYLGPYLECTWKPKTKTVTRKGCSNAQCSQYRKGNGAFCSTCGSKITSYKVDEPADVPSVHDILEKRGLHWDALVEMMWESDDETVRYLGPNDQGIGIHIDTDDTEHLDLREQDRAGEMKQFEVRYAKEIEALKKVYESVEVKWGLHQYFN